MFDDSTEDNIDTYSFNIPIQIIMPHTDADHSP